MIANSEGTWVPTYDLLKAKRWQRNPCRLADIIDRQDIPKAGVLREILELQEFLGADSDTGDIEPGKLEKLLRVALVYLASLGPDELCALMSQVALAPDDLA